jgi:dihydroxy-acid dehydratase
MPGTYKGKPADVVTVFEAIGAYRAGKITLDELYEAENGACPGAGRAAASSPPTRCHGIEFLGLSPAEASRQDPKKDEAAKQAGELAMTLVRHDIRPKHIVTRRSIENAIASVAATGGSTNGVLHLLAIAHEFGIPLELDEFGPLADRTPIVADLPRRPLRERHVRRGRGLAGVLLRAGAHGDHRPSTAGHRETLPPWRQGPEGRPRWRPSPTGGLASRGFPRRAGRQARGPRASPAPRPARVFDSEMACYGRHDGIVPGRHPLRGSGRRSRDAGDAERHRCPRRRGSG